MTPAEVAELSARIDLDGLRADWAALERRTCSIVSDLHPEDLDAVNDPAYIREVVEKDKVFREAGRWGEGYWAELPDRSKEYFERAPRSPPCTTTAGTCRDARSRTSRA
jgi:hypothetical protein